MAVQDSKWTNNLMLLKRHVAIFHFIRSSRWLINHLIISWILFCIRSSPHCAPTLTPSPSKHRVSSIEHQKTPKLSTVPPFPFFRLPDPYFQSFPLTFETNLPFYLFFFISSQDRSANEGNCMETRRAKPTDLVEGWMLEGVKKLCWLVMKEMVEGGWWYGTKSLLI